MNNLSRYEAMRTDPANWTWWSIYYCRDDPRLIVRNLAPFGWTWNFAHALVYPAIALAVCAFLGPAWLAYSIFGLKSGAGLGLIILLSLTVMMLVAHRAARDPAV